MEIYSPSRPSVVNQGASFILDNSDTPRISVRVVNSNRSVVERLRTLRLEGMRENSTDWLALPFSPERFEPALVLPFVLQPLAGVIAHYSDFDADMIDEYGTIRVEIETEDGKHWHSAPTHLRDPQN